MVKIITSTNDLKSSEGLAELLRKAGYEKEADKIMEKPKLSFLQRLGAGLQSFETANALYQSKYEAKNFFKTYGQDILTGLGEAITGKQIRVEPKKTYKDVITKQGIAEQRPGLDFADVLGFAGDVLLDPTTYLGGWALKGVGQAVKQTTKVGLKGVSKVAPKTAEGLIMATEGVKDAMGKAFVFGYKTSKGLDSDVIESAAKIRGIKQGVAEANAKIYKNFSKVQKEDLVNGLSEAKRIEQKVREGILPKTTIIAPKFKDPIVSKLYKDVLQPRRLKYSELADITEPFETYYPFIAKSNIKKFNEAISRITKEGYKKPFKNILKDDEILRNPAEVFARNEFEIVKNKVIREDLNRFVRTYGKPLKDFTSEFEAKKAGYSIIKEKGLFGKELGYLKEFDKKFVDNLLSPEFSTIDQLARVTGFDYATGLFKRFVTGIFAPFHIRNWVSGVIQNFEKLGPSALRPDHMANGIKYTTKIMRGKTITGTINIAGKTKVAKAIWEPFKKRFRDASQYISDFDQYFADQTGKIIDTNLSKLNPLDAQNYMFRGARMVGNFIETQQKSVAYLTALGQKKSINEALKLAEQTGFDYRMITPFESKVMKRLIPFYTFTRKNLELQVDTFLKHPERQAMFTKAFRDTFQPQTEESSLPEWMTQQFTIGWGKSKTGEKQVISGFGTPIEQFAYMFSGNPLLKFLSQTNPILKVPLEKATGKDFFRQQDLKDVYDAKEYSNAPQIVKDILNIHEVVKPIYENGKKTNKTKTVYVADPERLHIARNLFTSRMVNYIDTLFSEDELTGKARITKSLTGLKPYVVDEETVSYFSDKKKIDALTSILKRLNIIKEFSIPYLPKN